MEPFPGTGCDEKRSMLADCSVTQQTVTELHGKARLRYSRTTFNYSRTPHRHCTRFTYRSPTFTVYFRSYHFEVYFFFCLFSFRSINHANRFSSTFSYHSHYADVSFTFFPSDVWIFSVVLGSLLSTAIDSGKRGKNCFQKNEKKTFAAASSHVRRILRQRSQSGGRTRSMMRGGGEQDASVLCGI